MCWIALNLDVMVPISLLGRTRSWTNASEILLFCATLQLAIAWGPGFEP